MSCQECGSPFPLSHYGDCKAATGMRVVSLLQECGKQLPVFVGEIELIRGQLTNGNRFRLIVSEPISEPELRDIIKLIEAHADVLRVEGE